MIDGSLAANGMPSWNDFLTPDEVVLHIEQSGLRGRGGAGFPTGVKWSRVRNQPAGDRYVICNGDEGDPGAFMDRLLLESFPFRVVEGVAIDGPAIIEEAEATTFIDAEERALVRGDGSIEVVW